MIVQIVLVIMTAVQVNSQQLCPSVCEFSGDAATCKNLFSDVIDVTQGTFHSALRRLWVRGRTRLELEEDLFLRRNITALTSLDLSQNNITKIWQRAFYSLVDLQYLLMEGNQITTLDSEMFYYNTILTLLDLDNNNITDIHPLVFQRNIILRFVSMSRNKITSLHRDLFKNNVELEAVSLGDNRIAEIHPSTFRNNRGLHNVNLSGNKIVSMDPETVNQNRELQHLQLQNNNITDVHPSTFRENRCSFLWIFLETKSPH
jgi:Leucine-rich repeat (LRR) protein